ncbi:hypothetical protein [Borrelia turicatae]
MNEISGSYSLLREEFYLPLEEDIINRNIENK